MTGQPARPLPTEIIDIVGQHCREAFEAGWRAGSYRRATQPAPEDVIEEVVTMLDTALRADTLTTQQ